MQKWSWKLHVLNDHEHSATFVLDQDRSFRRNSQVFMVFRNFLSIFKMYSLFFILFQYYSVLFKFIINFFELTLLWLDQLIAISISRCYFYEHIFYLFKSIQKNSWKKLKNYENLRETFFLCEILFYYSTYDYFLWFY